MTREEAISAGKTHFVKFMMGGGGGRYVRLGNDDANAGTVCLSAVDWSRRAKSVSSSHGWKAGLKRHLRDSPACNRAIALHANGTATMAIRMKDGRVETLGMICERLTKDSPAIPQMPRRVW